MRQIFTIWKKELRDTIRDRRTLMSMIVMPLIIMPLIIIGIGALSVSQLKKFAEKPIKVAVINEMTAPELVELLKTKANAEVVKIEGDINQAVKEEKIDAGVIIPLDFQTTLKAEEETKITIISNSTEQSSQSAASRIRSLLTPFNEELLKKRFAEHKISPSITTGVTVVNQDIASDKERGGFGLSFILPLFIVMWSLIGGQYTAIDASAGERERKTLVALFLTPVKRLHIILGKFLAVATVALASVVISLTSMFVTMRYALSSFSSSGGAKPVVGSGIVFSLDLSTFGIMLVVSLLLIAMFSAVLLSIGIFAKSFKEAQSYISPAYLIIILPITLINSIPGLKFSAPFFALPGINAVALFKEIFVGTYNIAHIVLTIGSLALAAIIAIGIATRVYQKESVLFKAG